MATVNIRLTAPAPWHQCAIAARRSWPASVALQVAGALDDDDSDEPILVRARAGNAAPVAGDVPAPPPGVAIAIIVGAAPMSAQSFTAWAQRSVLGTASPLIGGLREWAPLQEPIEIDLPSDTRASHQARSALRSICAGLSCIDDVLLATSELTANALQHASGAPQLTAMRTERAVTVALSDERPDLVPVVQKLSAPAASSGRGMAIVNAISSHWGITVYHDHKVVWCELEDEHAKSSDHPAH